MHCLHRPNIVSQMRYVFVSLIRELLYEYSRFLGIYVLTVVIVIVIYLLNNMINTSK